MKNRWLLLLSVGCVGAPISLGGTPLSGDVGVNNSREWTRVRGTARYNCPVARPAPHARVELWRQGDAELLTSSATNIQGQFTLAVREPYPPKPVRHPPPDLLMRVAGSEQRLIRNLQNDYLVEVALACPIADTK
jgi:hypothetical protein